MPNPAYPAPGLYRHYKGALYRVLDCVRHSETEEVLVLYRALYGDFDLWVRPVTMFMETIERNGQVIARFDRLNDDTPVSHGS